MLGFLRQPSLRGLWLELPGLRVVHACWHAPFLEWLRPQLRDGRYLSRERMPSVTDEPAEVKLPRLRKQFSAWVRRAGVIPPFVVVG